jgi:two-component system sensor histidine kinase KdpD
MDKEGSVQRFLDLIRRSHRGKFKIYIGMSAGVGKSYRMLQEAHQLLDAGVDVCIGFIETHGRAETEAGSSTKARNSRRWTRRPS